MDNYKNKMNRIIIIIVLILTTNISAKTQDFNDWILTKDKDSVFCNITLVNDQNIFFEYKKRKRTDHGMISKKDVVNYYSKQNKNIQLKSTIDTVFFYGYDFSYFKLNDVKRIGQELNKFTYIWIDQMNDANTIKKLSSRMNIGKVVDYQYYIESQYKFLNPMDLVTAINYGIPKDSIQSIIEKYQIPLNSGVGFVVIWECFSDKDKTVSGYYVFFDQETKKILQSDYYKSYSSYSYNRVKDWGYAMCDAFDNYTRKFKIKFIHKENKTKSP
ncbi:MAG: hypothetical protein B7C24_14890 [Bacteroidetes bacterium 4572_77]|nr:MAG: hypothetical protein B7C24_14890 [Bacteroidetes bacterium 4572_77]